MIKELIVARVGAKEWREACTAAKASAADPRFESSSPVVEGANARLEKIPHEIETYIWDGDLSPEARIDLLFEVYDDMPAYGHLMYAKHNYTRLPPAQRQEFWRFVRDRLAGDDLALRQPLEYSLWCDFFEDQDTVHEAWNALVTPDASSRLLESVLLHSGPVPYDLKRRLYDRLLPDPKWHPFIFRSLLHSRFDYFGDFDPKHAEKLLRRLKIPEDTEGLADLRREMRTRKG
jgi:hypothetical protein